MIVTRKELLEYLPYVNENYINELVDLQGAPKEGHNQYDLKKFINWYHTYLLAKHKDQIEKLRNEKPQDLLASRSAELKEIQIKKETSRLVDSIETNEAFTNLIGVIISNLDGFAIKIAPSLIDQKDTKQIREIVQNEMDKLKDRIAKTELDILLPANQTESN